MLWWKGDCRKCQTYASTVERSDAYNEQKYRGGSFSTLGALRASLLFEQSKSQYSPGYEKHSIAENPQFRRISSDGRFRETDDLRLGDASPAIGAGVILPDDLQELDNLVAPSSGNPDIGCYPYSSSALQVGVESRRSYPGN